MQGNHMFLLQALGCHSLHLIMEFEFDYEQLQSLFFFQ